MRVTSEEELAEVIRGATTPHWLQGGGTRGMGLGRGGTLLDLTGLSGITLYEPGALTLVARAGTALAEVDAVLAAEGQRLACEPGCWSGLLGTAGVGTIGGTIGGAVAANVAGPRRVQVGALRDALLGVRFVDGTGALIKNGGRVMKNVTGYDLVKLMAGSFGTLGVLTEVSLKVLPMPEAVATLILADIGLADAVAAMAVALGSPYDVSGAARLPDAALLIRVEGFEGSVAYRARQLTDLLKRYGEVAIERDAARNAALWQKVRDVEPFHGLAGDVWRFSVKASDAAGVSQRLGGSTLLDWGGGLIWALLPEGSDGRALASPYRGHATIVRAGAELRRRLSVFEPEAAAVAALTAGLRASFDPKGILNPGLMD